MERLNVYLTEHWLLSEEYSPPNVNNTYNKVKGM